uniref:Sulfate ABC transporter protein n=1 Tax=Gymnomitrion concinnatum TaxID=209793 RepID=A0A3G6XML6_9MARC|nr:sulfate ABC transporter protein [Gymnomitrion concinnatum]AZB86868.1 sulfate ABC transporter protein [Gymnomitrion concinnatum]
MGILVDKVCKSLGDSKILDRISLYVPEFSLIALLGPSGSGKSSLLRIIAGLDTCDRGDVWLHGKRMTHVSIQYRKISFVFQHYALFKHMTVYDNISFGLQLRKFSSRKIENKINDLLNCLRIADISLQYPSQLSGGQKQRVALARSLVTQPDFLLLDEPFSALDGELRRHLRKWLKRYLQDNKITTIMVTHDQMEAVSMADEIVILSQGRLLQQGKPKKLYDQPINYFVGIFLGYLIEIPKLDELKKTLREKSKNLASDPIWVAIFANRSLHKYRFFLRPYEFSIESTKLDSESTPAQIETIIYKKTFIQLNVFVIPFLWNLAIPIGYQAFQDLHLQSLIQKIYIKPRIQVLLRAYSTLTS